MATVARPLVPTCGGAWDTTLTAALDNSDGDTLFRLQAAAPPEPEDDLEPGRGRGWFRRRP
ncbi:hypothetical protein ACWEQ7_36920 [Streptomyces sp. NPDC004069]